MSKSIILDNIYYLFWCLTHSIISFIQLIYNYLFQRLNANKYNEKNVNNLVNYLTKIPKHIAISINEDLINYSDLINIIKWCQQFGVRYVSLFSFNGLFVSCNEFEDYLMSCPKNGYKTLDNSLRHRKNGFTKTEMNGKSKRFIDLENLSVCIVSYEDSHQSIVNAAKQLCPQTAPIEQNDISLHLKRTFDFPDPELLLSFGSSTALYGYPIWQLRLTEMYFLPTHRRFQFEQFYQLLMKYSKCEQRFGK